MQLDIATRLDAINFIIGSIGLAPVDSEDVYNLDVAQAGQVLDNVSRTFQTNKGKGLWFNRERNWKFTPDPVTGQITVPSNALSVYRFDQYNRQVKIATRGRALYDTQEHGFDMRKLADSEGYLRLLLITQLDYEDLPQTAKDAIATQAAFKFAANNEMEVNRLKVLQQEAQEAAWALQAEDTTQTKSNAFNKPALRQFDALGGGPNNW